MIKPDESTQASKTKVQVPDSMPKPADFDPAEIERIIARIGNKKRHLVPLLQGIQKLYNYLPHGALEQLAATTEITPEEITGVSTFYSQFRLQAVGKHIIKTCTGTACHVAGAPTIDDTFRNYLKIKKGESTDANGIYTCEEVACLGCCMLAPVVQVDELLYANVKATEIPKVLKDFEASNSAGTSAAEDTLEDQRNSIGEIRLCLCSSCVAGGSDVVEKEIKRLIRELKLPARVKHVACTGISFEAPMVDIVLFNQGKHRYGCVKRDDVRGMLLKHLKPAGVIKRAGTFFFQVLEQFFTDEAWEPMTRYAKDTRQGTDNRFTEAQVQLVTEHNGVLNPDSIDDYLDHEGFDALQKALKMEPDAVTELVLESGLRGRGGAGFPTGRKWMFTAAAPGEPKYVVANGDEGDPGAFMDRMLLESFPFRVVEGMTIAAHAVGANIGYFYIRAEYPLATERVKNAIEQCEARGFLGENICGSGFNLKLEIIEGAGAFVCGEETALLSAIEGGRGMPSFRPPYPAVSGLWGKPTLINNVETFGLVPWIMRNGAKAFGKWGTEKSKGTKTFALAGKVQRGGLIEVPMGMSIRQIVNEIGGGVPEGRKLKAVLIGGPSGGCVPASLADTPVDYESLQAVGAIMGSGGLVVLDDTDCMVDIARYFLEFTRDESCGKCTSCRIGTMRLRELLDRICQGKGKLSDLKLLDELSEITVEGSLCGLGQTAPNPALSSVRYFKEEYIAHINGTCPALKCSKLIQYKINDECFGCTRCSQFCPVDAIPMNPYHHHIIQEDMCTRCDICFQVCPVDAVELINL